MANSIHQLSLFEYGQATNPSLSDEEIVRLLCEQLLDEADAHPPVPVEILASLRGITRISEVDQPWAGLLAPNGANFEVCVRASDSRERKRFTICHEVAHTLFPGFRQRQFRCGSNRSRLEQLCDLASSELVLPRRFFVPDLRSLGLGLDTVECLAGTYDASIESTALRAIDLGSETAALIVLEEKHKPVEAGQEDRYPPKLRVSYAHTRGSWPYLRRYKSVIDDSPFGRAWTGELVDEQGSLWPISTTHHEVRIEARRYGSRVLALVQPTT